MVLFPFILKLILLHFLHDGLVLPVRLCFKVRSSRVLSAHCAKSLMSLPSLVIIMFIKISLILLPLRGAASDIIPTLHCTVECKSWKTLPEWHLYLVSSGQLRLLFNLISLCVIANCWCSRGCGWLQAHLSFHQVRTDKKVIKVQHTSFNISRLGSFKDATWMSFCMLPVGIYKLKCRCVDLEML